MELKYEELGRFEDEMVRFNCTFMELKCTSAPYVEWIANSFNCTFMELKCEKD